MSDIVERLKDMFFRFGMESPEDAAKRRIQTAKDAAAEIEKLRAALNKISKLNAKRDRYSQEVEDVIIAALGEKK